MMTKFLYGIIIVISSFFLMSCSELKEEKIPTQTVVSVHGEGFANPASSNFHGKFIQSKHYDLTFCKQCHGSDYSGGTAHKSCLTSGCHNKEQGPENCMTCHGSDVNAAPPKDLNGNTNRSSRGVGAHQIHLAGSSLSEPIACSYCHSIPASLSSVGHIDTTSGAEIKFDSTSKLFRANAVFNNGSCENTYCHGNFNNGNSLVMAWTDTSNSAAACGTCHGDVTKSTLEEKAFPKTGHPSIGGLKCYQCHGRVVNEAMQIIDKTRHINGQVD